MEKDQVEKKWRTETGRVCVRDFSVLLPPPLLLLLA